MKLLPSFDRLRKAKAGPLAELEYRSSEVDIEEVEGFFVSGGTLPPDSASYIERSADRVLFQSLLAGSYCYVLNSRQLGKSSLSVHTMARLEEAGVRTAFVDLTRIGGANVTAEQWYLGFALDLVKELGLRSQAIAYWRANSATSPIQRLFDLIRDEVLTDPAPTVVFIDEIDATRSLPFNSDEFFAALRECFNRRVSDSRFARLTFCLLGAAVPSDLIRGRAITPFNIGERINLEDFSLEELSAFGPRLGKEGDAIIRRVHYWTSGHPFLSQRICRAIALRGLVPDASAVDLIVQVELFDYRARDSNINFADVANIALHYGDGEENPERFRADLLSVYQRIVSGRKVSDDESNRSVVCLKLAGLVRSDGRRLFVRNRIYEHVFDHAWIADHMPDQELRRQRQSFRRGVWRTALVASGVLALVGGIAAFAWFARLDALRSRASLDYQLYVADMSSLPFHFEHGDTGRIETILNTHRDSPYRGFEWGYWLGRYHDSKEEYSLDYQAPGKRIQGHVSADGRQICLVDELSRTATIVDRNTQKVLATTPILNPSSVMPSLDRWIELRPVTGAPWDVVDLLTNKTVCHLEPPPIQGTQSLIEHGGYVISQEKAAPGAAKVLARVLDTKTGRTAFSCILPANGVKSATVSAYGRYVACSIPLPNGPERSFLVYNRMGKLVDRFQFDCGEAADPGTFSDSRMVVASRTRVLIRNIDTHRSSIFAPTSGGEGRVESAVLTGHTLISLLSGGRCVVTDTTSKSPDITRENVFDVAVGSKPDEYLVSSSTVRVYEPTAGSSLAISGNRVTHFDTQTVNVFRDGGKSIQRVDLRSFAPVGTASSADDPGQQMYSGRWTSVASRDGKSAALRGASKTLPLPFSPAIWSCGNTGDRIVLWSPEKGLVGMSGSDSKVVWQKDLFGIDALWVSPDGSRTFLALNHRNMIVLDSANGRVLGSLSSNNIGPIHLSFSANGARVFTCGGDGRVVMWDAHTLHKLIELRGNEQEAMTSADISPDRRRLVTSSHSGSWQMWDASNGVQLLEVYASTQPLSSIVFSPDGQEVITAGDDNHMRIWKAVETNHPIWIPIPRTYLTDLHL